MQIQNYYVGNTWTTQHACACGSLHPTQSQSGLASAKGASFQFLLNFRIIG